MKLDIQGLQLLQNALNTLEKGFDSLPETGQTYDTNRMAQVLEDVAQRLQDNFPYFHPFYAGQMLKPPHPVAQLAYMLAMWINPNNHALDGGRASSAMEKEAVADMARMVGWDPFLGHLTGGGTMANLEALWVAGRLHPGQKVVASEQAHYTHSRISEVLKLEFESIPCDSQARMDIDSLVKILDSGNVGTVVATMGTTGPGSVDPLPQFLELRDRYNFRLHADAAYGGYFTLVDNLDPPARQAFDRLAEVDSLVIDPHKHGLQPYGCGCVLFKDPGVGQFYKHDSPYTYFSSSDLHLGEISLECSRAGASAVGLWATHQLLPPVKDGDFAAGLGQSRRAALAFYQKIANDRRFKTILKPELDIVVWAPDGRDAATISQRSRDIFNAAARRNLHLAVFNYPANLLADLWPDVELNRDHVTCLRSVLMKPEHLAWLDRIWEILDQATSKSG